MYTHTTNTLVFQCLMIRLLIFFGLIVPANLALAQGLPIVVSPQLRVSPLNQAWHECTVGVSRTDKNDVLVMAITGSSGVNALSYVALDWGSILPIPSTLDEGIVDPYITQHTNDGSLWFTANGLNGPIVGWKDAGSMTIPSSQTYVFSTGGIENNPAIAAGITPNPLSEIWTYIFRMKKTQGSGVCNNPHHEKQSFRSTPTVPGIWPWQPVEADPNAMNKCNYLGWGAAPVVLDDGRIVVALSDEWNGNKQQWTYNRGLPYIVYARPEDYDPVDDIYDWKPDDPSNPIRIDPRMTITATTITEDCLNICPRTDCYPNTPTGQTCNSCGDTPMQIDRRKNAPSIAVDRAFSPNHVFVAFYAKSDATSTNTDLYIARSPNGGLSFPDIPRDGNLLHITDAMLGLTELPDYVNNPDQMTPAIAVDACGDINVMFYDNRNDTNPNDCEYWVDVYFARISNFATNPTIQQWRLTPQSFRVDNLPASDSLGDYQNLSVSADGNTIYAAYIARNNADPVNGIQTCYLHRINLHCLGPASDMTGDGVVTDADMTAYMRAYNSQDVNAADVNLDWSVDASDLLLYSEWFAAKK